MYDLEQLKSHLKDHGWMVAKLPNPEPIYQARTALLQELRSLTGQNIARLESYHEIVPNDQIHTKWQIELTNFFRQERFGPVIIKENLPFFRELLGPDLNVQSNPYLRITRPGKPQDNIGYHRDTFYGGSPFELSVLVPYVDVSRESSLSILSGSHLRPESDFPTTQVQSKEVTKGSPKHQLGFLYAPKMIDSVCLEDLKPIPLKLGEVLVFTLATVHGSEENCGHISRWSSDIRVMNALAPVDLSSRPHYYETLSRSVVTELAQSYYLLETSNIA